MHTILQHPLITHKLTQMRRIETGTKDFRQNLDEITLLMVYEISHNLPLQKVEIETPISICSTQELSKEIILIPVLRAGLGMVDSMIRLMPTAKIGHIGLYRDHETLAPHEYYSNFPENLSKAVTFILDPMLATGGSASAAIRAVKNKGAKDIKLVCIVGAPEGLARVEKDHPDIEIFLAALDEKLNDKGYIVPGLGDAGDRIFGTN
jgi:uracil phosphoribosyltransferase